MVRLDALVVSLRVVSIPSFLSGFLAALLFTGFLFIYLRRRADRTALIFSLLCFFGFLTSIGEFMVATALTFPQVFFWEQVRYLGWLGVGPLALQLIHALTGRGSRVLRFGFFMLAGALVIALFIPGALVRSAPRVPGLIQAGVAPGPLFPVMVFATSAVVVISLAQLLIIYLRERDAVDRATSRAVLVGGALWFLSFLVNIGALLGLYEIFSLTEVGLLAFCISIAYALLRRFVTESQALEQTREELRIRERFASMGEIANQIVHEIRHDLNNITGRAHLMVESAQGESRELATDILRSADRLLEYSLGVAEFSRPVVIDRQPLALDDLVERVVKDHRRQAERRAIRLSVETDPEPYIFGDAIKLERVLANLLSNALEATPPGGAVRVVTERLADGAAVRVCDSGPGIPEGLRARVFEPFFTTKPGGMGLGLPICQKIVWAHGGRLVCDHGPGAGTTFSVILPRGATI